jgi:acyl-coenzyme A thioesterase PaaI-like protein
LGRVVACILHGGALAAFVDVLMQIEAVSEHSLVCGTANRLVAWTASELRLPLAWRQLDSGCLLVLRQ